MAPQHLELLVEEPSMEAFLRELLPRMLSVECTFKIHPFQGKPDLLDKLQNRLRAYAKKLDYARRRLPEILAFTLMLIVAVRTVS